MPIIRKKIATVAAPIARPDVRPRARIRHIYPTVAPAPVSKPAQPTATSVANGNAKTGYIVGYAKPPKHTQFQKGQSGNRKGRPKGAKGLKTIARELLSEKVTVRTAAGSKKMRKIEAMLHKVMEKAFAGDMRAIQALLQFYASCVPEEPMLTAVLNEAPVIHTDEHDATILEALRQTLRDTGDPS